MTTSPSWFDQEKFSRLVRKVGTKSQPAVAAPRSVVRPVSIPLPAPAPVIAAKTEPRPEAKASPPPFPSELNAPPPPEARLQPRITLPSMRGSAPLPALKPVFTYEKPVAPKPEYKEPELDFPPVVPPARSRLEPVIKVTLDPVPPVPPAVPLSRVEEREPAHKPAPMGISSPDAEAEIRQLNEDLAVAWEKVAAITEELSRAHMERDQAITQISAWRDQVDQADVANKDREIMAAQLEDMLIVVKERDDARREYARLREEFETLKQEQNRINGRSGENRASLEMQMETLRQLLSERENELENIRINSIGMEEVIETLKQELNSLQDHVGQARDETAVAQRSLAHSQQALQETRDALREASEGSSDARRNFENLKRECSTLVQQNMLLQAHHDQLSRELGAAKSKLAAKG